MPHIATVLNVLLACGCATAGAQGNAPAAAQKAEPTRFEQQEGWLDDSATDDEGVYNASTDADADGVATSAQIADRPAILAAARRALETNGKGAAKTLADDAGNDEVRVHATAQGAYIAQFPQHVSGIEVHGARVNVLLGRHFVVRAITGGTASTATVSDASKSTFQRDPASALRSAAGAVDGLLAASAMHEVVKDKAPYRYFELDRSPTFIPGRAARIKPIWYPAGRTLLPAYYSEISGRQPGFERPLARAVIVSAEDGRVLSSADLIRDYQPFAYRVFASPQGMPYDDPYGFTSPHPTGLPDGYKPSVLAPMNLVALSHAGISTGDPWLRNNATETLGNNIDAFFDADSVDSDGFCTLQLSNGYDAGEGDLRAQLTGPRTFDYTYDANDMLNDFRECLPPDYAALPIPTTSAQLNAKIVQMFYAGNWLHDYFYDLGFDEAAGNMQQDNYGRGGIGGDPLWMLSGGAHAYTYPADDGESPYISMGISHESLTRRDASAFDFAIIAHEWTHTMMERTAPRVSWTSQDGALGEGSADFIAQMLIVRAQDRYIYPGKPPFYGAYPPGAYANLDYDVDYDTLPPAGSPGNPDNTYYHGDRRFPLSADTATNPLTFKNIGIDHPLPSSPPAYDWLGRSLANAEVHTAGEIWSASMWECARNILVARPPARFEETRRRFIGDVVAGFKLFPADRTYTEARDAILYAIRADNEADYRRCRSGFAKRGMGAGSLSPDRYSVNFTGAVESFADRERALSIVDTKLVEVSGGDGDGVLDRGETGRLEVTLLNSGFSPLNKIRIKVETQPGSYDFPDGRQVDNIVLAAGATTTVSISVRVLSMQGAVELPLSVFARDQRRPAAQAQVDALFRVSYDLVRDRFVDSVAAEPAFTADWTPGFEGADPGTYCFDYCALQWQRSQHLGEPAYVIRDDGHIAFNPALEGHEFLVSDATPLRITLRHDYDFARAPGDPLYFPGKGYLLVSVDGAAWEDVATHLVSGPAFFQGVSNGWRSDTLDFGSAFAGRRVKFIWAGLASQSFATSSAWWAISRIEIEGAAEPMFSRMVADTQ